MTLISQLRSKFFAHKLISSVSEFHSSAILIDTLLSQAKLHGETLLSQASGGRVDHRRSALKGEITYHQEIATPTTLVLVLDINNNRQWQGNILQQINQIILYSIKSCEQLGIACIILYSEQGTIKEYDVEGLEQTIDFLNTQLKQATNQFEIGNLSDELNREYQYCYAIIISDRLDRDDKYDGGQIQHLLYTHQVLGYIRNYPDPTIRRKALPTGLIWLQ